LTCDFAPQEPTQRREPEEELEPEEDKCEGSDEEQSHDDKEEAEGKTKKRKKKSLPQGSNSQAHRWMRAVMPLLLGNPIGPEMGDAPARAVRNQLASEAIQRYQLADMTSMVQDIAAGTNSELDIRLRNMVLSAEKVAKLCSSLYMHITFCDTVWACRPIGSFAVTPQICSGLETPRSARILQLCSVPWVFRLTSRFFPTTIRWLLRFAKRSLGVHSLWPPSLPNRQAPSSEGRMKFSASFETC
jgi:hypothetical protein